MPLCVGAFCSKGKIALRLNIAGLTCPQRKTRYSRQPMLLPMHGPVDGGSVLARVPILDI